MINTKLLLVAALCSVFAQAKTEEEYSTSNRIGCAANLKGYHFNLKELSLPIDEEDRTKSLMYQLEFPDANGTSTIEFNLCEQTARRCPDLMIDHANIINSVGTCNHLSRVDLEDGSMKPGTLSLISEANPEMGVVMLYEGGNMCNETSKYSLEVQINCNPNLDKTTFALDKDSILNKCDPRVIMNSPHSCPVVSMGPLGQFLEDYNYWIGIPMILIGGYLAFAGGRFTGMTLFIFSTLAVGLAQLFFLFMYVIPHFSPTWTVALVGIVCLSQGVGLGYGAAKWPKIGVAIMGFSLGSLVGFFIYYAFLSSSIDTTSAKLITVFATAILAAILYTQLFDHMVIVTSAIFGSYILIRGISMYLGGYVNEFEVIMATNNGDLREVKWTVYAYWAFMILFAIVAVKAQLTDRKSHLEAYTYKQRADSSLATYHSMRESITRLPADHDSQDGDMNAQYLDESHSDQEPLQSHLRHRRP